MPAHIIAGRCVAVRGNDVFVVEGGRARRRTTETNIQGINGIEVLSELDEKAAIISPYPRRISPTMTNYADLEPPHCIIAAAFALSSAAVAVARALANGQSGQREFRAGAPFWKRWRAGVGKPSSR